MDLAIDIGGSKTLLAVFDGAGKIISEKQIKTADDYGQFIKDMEAVLAQPEFKKSFEYCCCAAPGKIDRKNGVGLNFGNLPWRNVPLKSDLQNLLGGTQILLENDANLAGIYEASEYSDKYRKILYLTISTGVGGSIITDGEIDSVLADSEVGHMVLPHNGSLEKWESFASGKALVKKYGKRASEIDDPKIWQEFAAGVAQGIDSILAVVQPEVVIIGGGVGAHLEKFQSFLEDELQKYQNNMVNIPPIIKAKRPEEAVIYGCYEYIQQKAG